MDVTGSLISAGASLVGRIFGGGGSQKAEWVTPKYGEIRSKAEAAGFNPLTALSMNAGGVGTTTTGPNFGQRLANGVSDAFTAFNEQKTLQTELDQRERELQMKEKAAEALSRQSRYTSGLVAKQSADVENYRTGPLRDPSQVRPKLRPDLYNQGQTVVIGPANKPMVFPKAYADRIGLKNWDAWIGEDAEALVSDVGGSLVTTPMLPNYMSSAFGGLNDKPFSERVGYNGSENEVQETSDLETLDTIYDLSPYSGY